MGRKIPGRKHKKIKDPNVQQSRRIAELKDKINNPPKKLDFQEMPKSVLRIMELKEKAKQIVQKQKLKKPVKRLKKKNEEKNIFDFKKALGKEVKMPGMDRPDRYIPEIVMKKNESSGHFLKRVNEVCEDIIKEVKFEKEFHVEVLRNEAGAITEIKKVKAKKTSKKPKLIDKRKERVLKKLNEKEPMREFETRDKFEFGEIVHEPPKALTIPGPKRKNEGSGLTPKPGKKDLLLKNVLEDNSSTKLTKLEKEKREKRRKLVVEAFRKSKKQNK